MSAYLNNHLSALKILTAVAYLLVYASGEKFGAFVFMILLLYPFLMADGASNIFSLNLNPFGVILIDTFFIAMSYWSGFYLLRSGIKNLNQWTNNKLCMLAIFIFFIYVIRILTTSLNSAFSLITIGIFVALSVTTLAVILIRDKAT